MKIITTFIATLFILSFNLSFAQSVDDQSVYELRTYTTHDGKLDDLDARFRDHTIGLFNKHGMESLGYWHPVDMENTLIYVIKHKSPDAAKKSWDDFMNDPQWKAVAKSSTADGPILAKAPQSVYMRTTDYSLEMLK